MRTFRNLLGAGVIALMAITAPMGHTATAQTTTVTKHKVHKVHKVKHTNSAVHASKVAAAKPVPPSSVAGTALSTSTTAGVAVDPNNGTAAVPAAPTEHKSLGQKIGAKWHNVKHKVKYNTYRMSHGGKTSDAEKAQDAAHEAADRQHEAEHNATHK